MTEITILCFLFQIFLSFLGYFSKNQQKFRQHWTCGEEKKVEKVGEITQLAEEEDERDCWELLVFFAVFLRFGPYVVGRGSGGVSGKWAQRRLMIRQWRALSDDAAVLASTVGDATA